MLGGDALDQRDDARQLLVDRDRRAPADRGLTADVDDPGAVADEARGVGEEIGVVARVGERVGRRVDDAHQQRRAAELQLATARAQPHVTRSLTFLVRRLPALS